MFTGIISHVGRVARLTQADATSDLGLTIEAPWRGDEVALGASIACSGVCLTVVERGDGWFSVQVSRETVARTTVSAWKLGHAINLERALRVGDELGGHILSGHVDAIAQVVAIEPQGGSARWRYRTPPDIARYFAVKGSVAVDGVSLTVNEVGDDGFAVNIIPHTHAHTNFAGLGPGDDVNIEVDMLARYVARLINRD